MQIHKCSSVLKLDKSKLTWGIRERTAVDATERKGIGVSVRRRGKPDSHGNLENWRKLLANSSLRDGGKYYGKLEGYRPGCVQRTADEVPPERLQSRLAQPHLPQSRRIAKRNRTALLVRVGTIRPAEQPTRPLKTITPST